MRTCKAENIFVQETQYIGVYLHGAYCAEHEFGIDILNKIFSVDPLRYKIGGAAPYENNLVFLYGKDYAVLIGGEDYRVRSISNDLPISSKTKSGKTLVRSLNKRFIREPLYLSSLFGKTSPTYEINVSGAWCDNSFVIAVHGKDNVKNLGALYDAFTTNDVAIWIGGGSNNPFGRPGLCLGIFSRLDPKVVSSWEEYNSSKVGVSK